MAAVDADALHPDAVARQGARTSRHELAAPTSAACASRGVRTVGHGGSANGQFAELLVVPERRFAVVALSNAFPDGPPCNQAVVRWALQTSLGVAERDYPTASE